MKNNQIVLIDFLAFFKAGKFDYIKLGQTKEWIINNFPKPDAFKADFMLPKFQIWTYGVIEFHFDLENKLYLVFSDYLHKLNGGKQLTLKKWFFDDKNTLNLSYVLSKLNTENIDYKKKTDKLGILIRLKSGIELTFENPSDYTDVIDNQENTDFNDFILTSFSLIEENLLRWK